MARARFRLAVFVAVCLMVAASRAAAATGSQLRVSLDHTVSVADLAVSITRARDASETRTAPIDDATDAVFADLPPGLYDVMLLERGAVRARHALQIGSYEGVSLEVRAGASGLHLAEVDRHQIAMASVFDERLLSDLPASRDVWTLIETSAPYAIVDRMDNGGAAAARTPFVGSRSSSWTATTLALGDLVVTAPGRTGALDLAPDTAFLDSVSVSTGLAPVEVGTPGVLVTMTPRRPGPTRSVEVFGSLTTRGMVGANALDGAPSGTRIDAWREGGAVLGGPVRARAGLLVAVSANAARYTERGSADQLGGDRASAFGHLVVQPAPGRQFRLVAGAQRTAHPFDDRRQFADRRGADERARLWQTQASWERQRPDGSWVRLSGGIAMAHRAPSFESDAGGVVDRLTDGLVPLPPAVTDRTTLNVGARWDDRERRWGQVSHGPRGGVTVRRESLSSSIAALPAVAEQVAGLPARVWLPQAPAVASQRGATHVSAWAADHMAWSPRLTLDLGVRLDHSGGSADGADQGLSWTAVSPRASFRWARAPFAVFGAAGQYASSHVLGLLAHGDPGEAWFAVHRWRDDNGDGRFDGAELGELVARAGLGQPVASIGADVRGPLTREALIGAEFTSGPHTLHGAILVRRESRLVGSFNAGVPAEAWDARAVPDANADWEDPADDRLLTVFDRQAAWFGLDRFVLANAGDERVTYGGIEIGWRFLSERWSMLFGARAYRTRGFGSNRGFGPLENDQHLLGELHQAPNATPQEPGSLYFDRSYVGKWAGSFHATDSWRLAFAARYQDGQPFSRVVVVPDLRMGPDLVQAYRLGQTRYTYTFTLDARIEKTIRVSGRELSLRLDVFNLTNHQNELDEDVRTSPAFRTPTSVQPPLTLRLGGRIRF